MYQPPSNITVSVYTSLEPDIRSLADQNYELNVDPNVFLVRYQRTTTSWQSDEPILTVPDLEDSVEALYARAQSGVQQQAQARTMRPYPVDPTSVTTAREVLETFKKASEDNLKAVQLKISEGKQLHRKKKKDAEKEAELFEEFKKTQQQNMKDGK